MHFCIRMSIAAVGERFTFFGCFCESFSPMRAYPLVLLSPNVRKTAPKPKECIAVRIQQRTSETHWQAAAATHIERQISNIKVHCWIFNVLVSLCNILYTCATRANGRCVKFSVDSGLTEQMQQSNNKQNNNNTNTQRTHGMAIWKVHTYSRTHRHISLSRCAVESVGTNAENSKTKQNRTNERTWNNKMKQKKPLNSANERETTSV